jgi:hypothetical protein
MNKESLVDQPAYKAAHQFTCQQQILTLQNLLGLLDKAKLASESKKFEFAVLFQSRLSPDMFPLIKQIQIACDTAKFNAARLTGKDAPQHPDNEQSLEDAQKRIQSVISFLQSFKEADFKGYEERKITQPRWEGKWMTGRDFLTEYAMPNFFFHVVTAYNILRHNGVDIGKRDYLGKISMHS